MRVKPFGLTIVASALLALATPACASNQTYPHKARVHRHTAPQPDAGAWGAASASSRSGQDDCPNGDCRGLNSPGNMGGAHGDF